MMHMEVEMCLRTVKGERPRLTPSSTEARAIVQGVTHDRGEGSTSVSP